jgi:hypothetical protein
MCEAKVGAYVKYCGHDGYFVADIFKINGVNVVHANGPVTPANLIRPADGATHFLSDFPSGGFWNPRKGVFVVPEKQVKEIK